MDALNKRTAAASVDNKPKAHFRTKDISVKRIYSSSMNFYSMPDIEELAATILAVGLLENITVVYEPSDAGEYRIIAGERRWRALRLLVDKGHKDFETVTCQIKTPAEQHEEMVQLIIANAYRIKTPADILEEERQLKASLQYMKDNGLTLQGYQLDSGRLRDVIAAIMNMSATKVAQIESINNNLIPEFAKEFKEGRLTLSAAYEISGMEETEQQGLLTRHAENGLTLKEVKEAKAQARQESTQERTAAAQTDERQPPDKLTADTSERVTEAHSAENKPTEKQAAPAPEITKLTAAEMQEFDKQMERVAEQAAETTTVKKKLHLSPSEFQRIVDGGKPYIITKNDKYSQNEVIALIEYKNMRATGNQRDAVILYMDTESTSSALSEGYCVLGVKLVQNVAETAKEAGQEAGQAAAQPIAEYGA